MILHIFLILLGIVLGITFGIRESSFWLGFLIFMFGCCISIIALAAGDTSNEAMSEEHKQFTYDSTEYPEQLPGGPAEKLYLFADVDDGDVAYGYLVTSDFEFEPKAKVVDARYIHLHSDDGTPRIEYFRQTGYDKWYRYIYAVPNSSAAHVYIPDTRESIVWGFAH